jgi:hypothetical protein
VIFCDSCAHVKFKNSRLLAGANQVFVTKRVHDRFDICFDLRPRVLWLGRLDRAGPDHFVFDDVVQRGLGGVFVRAGNAQCLRSSGAA